MAKYSPAVLLGQANTWTATQTIELAADLEGLLLHSDTATRRGQFRIDTVRTADGQLGSLLWLNDGDTVAEIQAARTGADDAANILFQTQAAGGGLAEKMRLTSTGQVLIGDTASSNNDAGLTINQGTADDEILTLKETGIAHGMTTVAETDTFATLSKASSANGGLNIRGISASNTGIQNLGYAAAPNTASTSSGIGVINERAFKQDGTGTQDLAAGENVYAIRNGGTTHFLVKGDGDIHVTNATLTAFDAFDDVGLVRLFQREVHNDMGIAISKWDDHIQANKEDLIEAGILSGEGHFRVIQRYEDLLGGAIWQTHERVMALSEKVTALALENAELHTMLEAGRN